MSVVKLVKAGFKEKTIITIINNRPADFNLDTEQLIELKRNGVNENIILAMLSSQMGTVFVDDEDEWSSDPFFKGLEETERRRVRVAGRRRVSSDPVRARNRRADRDGGLGGNQNEGNLSGSATVRIIKPPAKAVRARRRNSRRRRR